MPRIGNRTFNDVQLNNARVIADVGTAMGASDRDIIIALDTAIVESNIKRLASRANPGSLNYPHDGVVAGDHDSVGIFQQRDSWGSLQERMDAADSARLFFTRLLRLKTRNSMSIGQAAQAVQRSAFPERYAEVEPIARELAKYIAGQPPRQGVRVYVWGRDVNVRRSPSTSSEVLDQLSEQWVYASCQRQGETVRAEGYTNNWWSRVTTTDNAQARPIGYISNIYIRGGVKIEGVPDC